MSYEFRISKQSDEIHIFKSNSEKSICKRTSNSGTEEIGIYRGSKKMFSLKNLHEEQAQELASTLDYLNLNICGTCVSHLYKTQD